MCALLKRGAFDWTDVIMYTIGVWDGHDSGAVLLKDGEIAYAANEERFTKRKLEINFPSNAISAAIRNAGIKPTDIERAAFTTTEFSKTIERVFPIIKENYYQFRRRKMLKPGPFDIKHNHWLKYAMTSIGPLPGCVAVSRASIAKNLMKSGIGNIKIDTVEHHTAHAATAAFTSGFDRALVITLDGVGDGLCGSVSTFENKKLERRLSINARDSLGMFFEQVTNIVGMRELEDEGKVMAMACYSYPFQQEENKLHGFYDVTGTRIRARYGWHKQYRMLENIAWSMPREQFSYMAQQILESCLVKFISNCIDRYGIRNIALAGGVFANVKANMLIRRMDNVDKWYVFPHMGDGGIALGSALYSEYLHTGKCSYKFSAYTGESYTQDHTEQIVKSDRSLSYSLETPMEQAAHAAELISKGNYLMWFQGRMEYGPRALGDRSIIAPADSESVKEKLNLYVKKREWYQPFAPSVLESEVKNIVEYDGKGYDRYMTMAYMVKKDLRDKLKSVIHIDGSARPQMVGAENPTYMELLKKVRKETGLGIVLNTSFNLHGFPIVMTPEDAIATMKATKTRYMFMNNLFITNKAGV
jgi:carbamoyltransferase